MATAIAAGLPLSQCLALLAEEGSNLQLKKALEQMTVKVKKGTPLWEAMRKHGGCFDELYVTTVKAGEAGGVLPQVLNHLAMLMEESAWRQNKLKSALFYLAFVAGLAIAVFMGMCIFIVPNFTNVFADLGSELPPLTVFVLGCSEFLRNIWKVGTLILSIMAIAFLYKSYYNTPEGRANLDGLKLKLPFLGEFIKKTVLSRFCFILGILIGAGIPIVTAWEMSRNAIENQAIAKALKAAQNEMRLGSNISLALQKQRIFPARVIQAIAIAEEAGTLDTSLMKISTLYEIDVEKLIKIMTVIGWIVVGGIVGLILIAMYLPMFAVYDKLG